jgi:hypothetical protein
VHRGDSAVVRDRLDRQSLARAHPLDRDMTRAATACARDE